ncbi:MAG: hypothetical protein LAO30_23660, partial [Acidobacteriia bacterium]|nr:hypothetical protein [Terriglobia bacterium]
VAPDFGGLVLSCDYPWRDPSALSPLRFIVALPAIRRDVLGTPENGVGASAADGPQANPEELNALVGQIEAMATALGRRLYRGVLKTVARVWNPTEIREADVLRSVLEQMQAAERGLLRLKAAFNSVEPGTLVPILRSLGFSSLDQVDSLESLKRVVLEVEQAAEKTR